MNSDQKAVSTPHDDILAKMKQPYEERIRVCAADGLLLPFLLVVVSVASLSSSPKMGILLSVGFLSVLILGGYFFVCKRPSLTYALPILLACQYAVLLSGCHSMRVSDSLSLSPRVLFLALPILLPIVRPRLWAGLPDSLIVLCVSALLFSLILMPLAVFRFQILTLFGMSWVSLVSMVCLMTLSRASLFSSQARKAIALYCLAMLVAVSCRIIGLI